MRIHAKELPCPESAFREGLADYLAAREDHKNTVDIPAPLPAFEIMRVIAEGGGKLEIYDDPAPTPPTESELLAASKAGKVAEINAACRVAIVGGFSSSALGGPHFYDSEEVDQINLIGAVALGVDLPYRCADAAGVKQFRPHTAAQLRWVAQDGAAVKLAALQQAAALRDQVTHATTVAEVDAIA